MDTRKRPLRAWLTRRRQGATPITLIATVALFACAAPSAADFTFEQYEVVTGPAKHQTVLSGFFLDGNVAELAVVSVEENDDRRLRLFTYGEGTWVPIIDVELRKEVLFVDVANIGGRDRLVTYERGGLNWFDPDAGTERELVSVTSVYNAPLREAIPHIDVTRDVNADGLDDLVVPDFDGFWILVQTASGHFAKAIKLGPPVEMGMAVDTNPWYQARPMHEIDFNRDGLIDLMFWNEDHFVMHPQDQSGAFAPAAEVRTTDVAFDTDGIYSISFSDSSDDDNTKDKVLHSLGDLNGDGVADLVTFSLEGRSVVSKHSVYEVHFGSATADGGTTFAPDAGTAIESDGIQFDMRQHDLDGDGGLDMMGTTFHFGIGKIIGALLTGSTSLDLEFYRMDDDAYPEKPNVTRKIVAEFDFSTGDAFFPSVLVADVNGDDRLDLLVQEDREELHVFMGVPGSDLFARRPQKIAVAMPDDEDFTWLVNLNRDGKRDILMHHAENGGEPHRVTMLIAQ